MYGKVVVIEGNDRVGKNTQAKLLTEYIKKLGHEVMMLSFPNYGSLQSKPVESYLTGCFPTIKPLEASLLFAFDRAVTFREKNIDNYLKNGGILILDRYTPSNLIYQVAKAMKDNEGLQVSSEESWQISYKIEQLEYNILGLPRPSTVIYLHLPRNINKQLLESAEEIKGVKNDIHEKDEALLDKVSEVGMKFAKLGDWHVIDVYDENKKELYPKEHILNNILDEICDELGITKRR